MKKTVLACTTALLLATLPGLSQARDTTLNLPFQPVLDKLIASGKIDGSVKFYLAGTTPKGKVSVLRPGEVTNQKTNAFNKSDAEACEWVMQSALIKLHDAAKQAGGNAVTNITSFYKRNETKSSTTYECHAGAFIAGVALKGDLSKVQ